MKKIIYLQAILSIFYVNGYSQLVPKEKQEVKTFARFVPERKDDFAWENDIVAFRTYGPALRSGTEDSGIDCWLKRVNYSIIDNWYTPGKNYHKDAGEGHDPYHVGSSRGCGGTALWIKDSMITSDTYISYKVISYTKEKTVFELLYEYPSQADEAIIKEKKTITIELSKNLFDVTSTFTQNDKPVINLPVVVGVTTHDEKAKAILNEVKKYVACYETIEGGNLGTGVVLNKNYTATVKHINLPNIKDASHVIMVTKTNAKGELKYKAGYGWDKAGKILNEQDWINYLNKVQ